MRPHVICRRSWLPKLPPSAPLNCRSNNLPRRLYTRGVRTKNVVGLYLIAASSPTPTTSLGLNPDFYSSLNTSSAAGATGSSDAGIGGTSRSSAFIATVARCTASAAFISVDCMRAELVAASTAQMLALMFQVSTLKSARPSTKLETRLSRFRRHTAMIGLPSDRAYSSSHRSHCRRVATSSLGNGQIAHFVVDVIEGDPSTRDPSGEFFARHAFQFDREPDPPNRTIAHQNR